MNSVLEKQIKGLCLLLPLSLFLFFPATPVLSGTLPRADSAACNTIPSLNKKVKSFVASRINKKEGDGSCWALAKGALNSAGAAWNGAYEYGLLLNPETDCIFPGDIIQFEGVEIRYGKDGARFEEHMQHHTAVIYKVLDKGKYQLAHQNFGRSKKVCLSELDVQNIISGNYFIYRPTKGE